MHIEKLNAETLSPHVLSEKNHRAKLRDQKILFAMSTIEDLLLDSQLKWGMLLPISIAMVLVGLLRSNLTELLSSKPKLEFFKKAREKYVYTLN